MTKRMNTSASRITLGAVLLALAATASSCGMALPTQPAVDTGLAAQKNAATTTEGSPSVTDDNAPSGGPGVEPPVGEVIVPTPGRNGNHWAWGHYKNKK